VQEILNFLAVSEWLGTAGQPERGQFAAIAAAGYDLVINLAMPDSTGALADEADLVRRQGLEYVHIPVVWEAPTLADLERFVAVMDRFRDNKVFVHCAMNMRVSCFVLLYRVLRLGVPLDEAWQTMQKIWQPDPVWSSFIERCLDHYGCQVGDRSASELSGGSHRGGAKHHST
jgi:protein tyrosine phosphatase (PTP) superfamily phosphohydrolase (DUF442 family)